MEQYILDATDKSSKQHGRKVRCSEIISLLLGLFHVSSAPESSEPFSERFQHKIEMGCLKSIRIILFVSCCCKIDFLSGDTIY